MNATLDWRRAELEVAIEYGSHPMEEEAMKQFCEDAYEKKSEIWWT